MNPDLSRYRELWSILGHDDPDEVATGLLEVSGWGPALRLFVDAWLDLYAQSGDKPALPFVGALGPEGQRMALSEVHERIAWVAPESDLSLRVGWRDPRERTAPC